MIKWKGETGASCQGDLNHYLLVQLDLLQFLII